MPSSVNKRGLMPRLRFPEFREAGEWEEKEVGEVFKVTRGEVLSMTLVTDTRTGDTPYPVFSSQTKNNGLAGFYSEYLYEGAITWTTDGANAGDVKYRQGKFYCTNVCGVLLNQDGHANPCIAALINSVSKKHVSYVGNPKLMNGVMSKIVVPFPSLEEQQTIADCLVSLDELITLEAQKLDTLKTHKKGLMQQLFPAEGETLPKLRFPEFRDAGEWDEKRLGDIGSVRMCKRILKEQTSPRGDIPFYKIGTFGGVPDAYIAREIFENFRNSYPFPKNGAVLISAAGTIGRTVRYNGELAYFQDSNIVWLDNSEKLIADNFLFYLYQLIDWSPSVGAIQRLYNENLLGAQVKFPSIPEQQKIADCLASLDDLIAAQTQKLAALKTHKKGLMQQLFPSVGGVPEGRGG